MILNRNDLIQNFYNTLEFVKIVFLEPNAIQKGC